MTKEQEKVLAVDGDIIAYRTAAVCEDHFAGAGYAIIDSTLKEIAEDTGITKMRIYLSGKTGDHNYAVEKDNFRLAIGKTKPYKGNRATMVRPIYLPDMIEWLMEKKNAIMVDGYEADDAVATDMTVNGAFHCGIDKDILQIAGKHYNYVKKEWKIITPDEAILILHRQILMGDTSDNIPGLPKWGVKTAEKAIQNPNTALEDVMEIYQQVVAQKMPDTNYIEYLAEQQALITMVKDIEIDYNKFYIQEISSEGFEVQKDGWTGIDTPETDKLSVKL